MKQLLLILTLGFSLNAFSQFTIGSTSLTYQGNGNPTTGNGRFYVFHPYPDPTYVDANCATQSVSGDVGGFDPNWFDASSVNPARSNGGAITYGGGIRRVFQSGTSCAAQDPSFGFNTTGANATSTIDLSSAANQLLKFDYQSDLTITLYIQLYDQSYTQKLDEISVSINGDGAVHTETVDFSSVVKSGADMTNIFQVSFEYKNTTKSGDFGISFNNIFLGSSVAASTNSGSNLIAGSMLYPNPSSDNVSVNVNLSSTENIKVVVSDLLGKEVLTVAEGNFSEISTNFSVAFLNKGMYTVTYLVNGSAAKSELLMVK